LILFFSCSLIFSVTINDIIIYYETGEYDKVVIEGEKILKDFNLEVDDLINLQTYIAFSYIAKGDTLNGQKYFENILSIDNNYILNEEFVSPKIIKIFSKAKERINFLVQKTPNYYRIEKIPDTFMNRKDLLIKSAFLPGWGQMGLGEKSKSITLSSLFLSSLIGSVTTYIFTVNMKNIYLNSKNEIEAEKNYQVYNNWSKINRFFVDLTFSVYIFNIFDILW